MNHGNLLRAFLIFFLCCSNATAQLTPLPPSRSKDSNTTATLDAVVRDLCTKQVVLLGEPSHHGDARSVEFKAALVQRLADECHFGAFFIESPIYDFLNFDYRVRTRRTVDPSMLSNAIGKMWSTEAEFQPLSGFLFKRAIDGKLLLGGIDDQLSSTAEYVKHEMSGALTSYLKGETQTRCSVVLQTHLQWRYNESHKYGPDDTAALLSCLNAIQTELASTKAKNPLRRMHANMAASLARSISRDSPNRSGEPGYSTRERSMYMNYESLASDLKKGTKIIVWVATAHGAKSAPETAGVPQQVSFGTLVRQGTHGTVATLGFSTLAGSFGRNKSQLLPPAPEDSLEMATFANNEADERYCNLEQLQQAGSIPARLFGADFQVARWDTVLDGLVVFREGHPPEFLDR